MIRNYATIALRNLLRDRVFALVNLIGLSIGIGCCIIAVAYIRYELGWDRFHDKADRIYRVLWTIPAEQIASEQTSGPLSKELTEQFPEVESSTRIMSVDVWVRSGETYISNTLCVSDPSFFDIFTFPLLRGDFGPLYSQSILLTESCATRLFGDLDPIGQTLNLESRLYGGDYVVTGILKDMPSQSSWPLDFALFVTAEKGPGVPRMKGEPNLMWKEWIDTTAGGWVQTWVLLRSHEDRDRLAAKLPDLLKRQFDGVAAQKNAYRLQPIEDVHLYGRSIYGLAQGGDVETLYRVGAIAALILIVACVNYVNLSTARAASRSREIGIRKVSGAKSLQLFAQFTGESFALVLIATTLGVGLAQSVLPWLSAHSTLLLSNLSILEIVYPVLPPFVIIVALAAGLYPAVVLSSLDPVQTLKSRSGLSLGDSGLRRWLVVAQFGACVFLVTSMLVMHDQTQYLRNADLGFDKDLIVTMPLFGNDRSRKTDWAEHLSYRYRTIKAEVLRYPRVYRASAYRDPPGTHSGSLRIIEADGQRTTLRVIVADEDFTHLFDIPVLRGRNFDRSASIFQISSSRHGWEYILNESAIRQLGWEDPIGKTFNWRDGGFPRDGQVVGVVRDFNAGNLRNPITPLAIMYNANRFSHLGVKIDDRNVAETIAFLKNTWQRFLPERPFEYEFLDERIARQYRREEQVTAMVTMLSILAVLLGCMGLFGLASLTVARRRKEIGIRRVLGDSTLGIVWRLARQSTSAVMAASVFACPVSFYLMSAWLDQYAYRIDLSIWHFFISGGGAFFLAVVTVGFQSIRAARANPVDVLRDE